MHHPQSTPGTHTATHAHAPAPARMATAPTMLDVMLKHQIFGRGIFQEVALLPWSLARCKNSRGRFLLVPQSPPRLVRGCECVCGGPAALFDMEACTRSATHSGCGSAVVSGHPAQTHGTCHRPMSRQDNQEQGDCGCCGCTRS